METTVTDSIFGEMTYRHRWYKKDEIILFGRQWDILITAKAYSEKPITKEQRNSYQEYLNNKKEIAEMIEEQIKNYVNSNLYDLASDWIGARRVNYAKELAQMVIPKNFLFKQDGTAILLLDCIWDVESGIAVKVLPDIAIGNQDLFL